MTGSRRLLNFHWLVICTISFLFQSSAGLIFFQIVHRLLIDGQIAGISILFQKTFIFLSCIEMRHVFFLLLAIARFFFSYSLFASKFAIAHKGRGKNDFTFKFHTILFTAAL